MAVSFIDLSFDPVALAIILTVKLDKLPEFSGLDTRAKNVIARITESKWQDARLCDVAINFQQHGKKKIMETVKGAGTKTVNVIEQSMNKALQRLWNERNIKMELEG